MPGVRTVSRREIQALRRRLKKRLTPDEFASLDMENLAEHLAAQADEAPPDHLPARHVYRLKDLALWRNTGRNVSLGVMPTNTTYSNPCLCGDHVVGLCTTGLLRAVGRDGGETLWSRRLPRYGNAVYGTADTVYVGMSYALLALDPEIGRTKWEYAPCPRTRERIYSSPVVTDTHVFLGDRGGQFRALAADTGKVVWSAYPSRAQNNNINSTALVWDDRVMVATNSRLVLAYDMAAGHEIWRQKIDGPSTYEVLPMGEMAVVMTRKSVYALSPANGEILHRWTWRMQRIEAMAVAGDVLLLLTRKNLGVNKAPHHTSELVALRGDTVLYRKPYPRYCSAALRFEPSRGLLYESTYCGIGILDPASGDRLAAIHDFGRHHRMSVAAIPSVRDEALYLLIDNGSLCAARHP